MCESGTKRPPVDGFSYGFMVSWPDMSVAARGFGRSRGSILTGGHVSILAAIRPCLPNFWGCYGDCDSVSCEMTSQHASASQTALCTVRLQKILVVMLGLNPDVGLVVHAVSHLSGTRHVDTLSSCRSLCWSHRHEGGCRQCTVASWVLYKTRSDIAWPGGTITRSETFWLSCLLLLLSFKLRFRHKTKLYQFRLTPPEPATAFDCFKNELH